MQLSHLILVSGLLSFHPIRAKPVNVTIDDQYGDPKSAAHITYLPEDAWDLNALCSGCNTTPESQLAYMQTWHVGTFNLNTSAGSDNGPANVLSAAVPFNGSAVYVYCILPHFNTTSDGNSDMTFIIDGLTVGSFVQPTTKGPSYEYSHLVYQNTSLSPEPHNLILYNGHTGGAMSLVILDYITYTFDDGTPNSTSAHLASSSETGSKTKIIVGAVVGSVCGVFLIALAFVLWRRYIRNISHHPNDAIRAYAPRPHSRIYDPNINDWPGGPAYAYANSAKRPGPSQSTLQTASTSSHDSSHIAIPKASVNKPAPNRFIVRGQSDTIVLDTPPIHEEPGQSRTKISRSDSQTTYPPDIPVDAPPAYLYQDPKDGNTDSLEADKRRRRSLRKPVPRLEDV